MVVFIDALREILSSGPKTTTQISDLLYDQYLFGISRYGCHQKTLKYLNAMLRVGEVSRTGRGSVKHPYVWTLEVKE